MSSESFDRYVRIARLAGTRRDPAALCSALTAVAGDPDAAVETLGRHTLIGLVLRALPAWPDCPLPPGLADRLEPWRRRHWTPAEAFVAAQREAGAALDAAGVPVLWLKGLYFAERLYGGLERRPMHDLDLFVPPAQHRQAMRALRALGYRLQAYDPHSRTLQRGEIKIDLHRCLRSAPAFRVDERRAWTSSIEVTAGPLRVRTLSDEWTLVLLLLAAFEDIGQATIKLKQLLDTSLLLDAIDATFDWDGFFRRLEPQRLAGAAANVLDAIVTLFEGHPLWPRLCAALDERRGIIVEPTREGVTRLICAPRKHAANLAWFGRVYPGSLAIYLAWFWYGSFPSNVSQLSWSRVAGALSLPLGVRRPAPGRRGAGASRLL